MPCEKCGAPIRSDGSGLYFNETLLSETARCVKLQQEVKKLRDASLKTSHKNGALGMRSGDRVTYILNGKSGIAAEFLQDGDADVNFDDGSFATVKWINLIPEQKEIYNARNK